MYGCFSSSRMALIKNHPENDMIFQIEIQIQLNELLTLCLVEPNDQRVVRLKPKIAEGY